MVTSINTDGKNQLEVFTSEITTLRKRIDDLHDRNERLLDKIESLTQALGEQYKKNNALIALLAEQGIKPPVRTQIQ